MTLNITDINKSFEGLQALTDITFSVKEGELFGLIGPDGSGKTTLFRIITTLLLPDRGEVNLFGINVLENYKKIRQLVGYMAGRFSLYHDLTVEENLKFYATVFGTTIEKNYDLIKDVYCQIEPFKTRKAGKLSGGMKQKLALSCALIHKPKLLVLDEPTTGVDAVSRMEFWEMLKRLQKRGITILVSTSYMDEASLCDRVGLIQKGNLLSVNKPEKIITEYQKELLSVSSDNLYKLVNDLRSEKNTHSAFLFGQSVHLTRKDQNITAEQVVKYLQHNGHENIRVKVIKPGIEDCFMDLMNEEDEVLLSG
ncbi:MAG: ABC transporter ATP-binding protein [Bacteroidales bacterium]|nr:ABC transporter ATP-binding protein [Bacteroidales bacterium]